MVSTTPTRRRGFWVKGSLYVRIDPSKVEMPSSSTNAAPPTSNAIPRRCRQPPLWTSRLTSRFRAHAATSATPRDLPSGPDQLRDAGLLTNDEFNTKKAELLARL